MAFKSFPVALGATDTDVFECPAATEAAAVLLVSNVSASSRTYTLKFYKASTGVTKTLLAGVSIAANTAAKVPTPLSLEAGDKIVMSCSNANDVVVGGTITLGATVEVISTFVAMGEWEALTTYTANVHIVTRNGNSYLARPNEAANLNQDPATATDFWMLLAAKGETGDGDLSAANNLSDLADTSEARINLGVPVFGPQGRLTLTSATPITVTDVAGATSIYWTPLAGQSFPRWNGSSAFATVNSGGELTLALDSNSGHTNYHQSAKIFDLFLISDGGTPRLGTGPAWSSDTSRGTGAGTTELEFLQGFPVNKNSITIRFGSSSGDTVSVPARQATYVGSFRATANGQASDTAEKRLLFNAYNAAPRKLRRWDATTSWTYSTDTWRQANADTNNRVDVLAGLTGVGIDLSATAFPRNSGTTGTMKTSIGLDSTTAISADLSASIGQPVGGTGIVNVWARLVDWVPLGYHSYNWLEKGASGGTTTFFNVDSGGTGEYRAGLAGQVVC